MINLIKKDIITGGDLVCQEQNYINLENRINDLE